MFRPEIKVFDCTIRDGGLVNSHRFSHDLVRKVWKALTKAGVDYMEIGYRGSKSYFNEANFGPWKFCEEKDLEQVIEPGGKMKIAAMVDVGRVDLDSIPDAKNSLINVYRVATYVKDIDAAIMMANHCHDKGYETTINIMAISVALFPELTEALHQISEETHVAATYIVDSYGALFSEEIHYLVQKYKECLKGKCEIGIHAHNNQQLGYANTIEAIRKGANFLDATIYGMGRGAGNCPMECLLGFLKNPKFNLEPIFEVIEMNFEKLYNDLGWGYRLPYLVSGQLNRHPEAAISWLKSDMKSNHAEFLRKMLNDE